MYNLIFEKLTPSELYNGYFEYLNVNKLYGNQMVIGKKNYFFYSNSKPK